MNGGVFGVCFLGHSYPIGDANFTRVDETHWVLDVNKTVRPEFWEVKEAALFLMQPNAVDASLAISLYVKALGSDWLYRGCVHATSPSAAMSLQWPVSDPIDPAMLAGNNIAQVGVSVEPVQQVANKEQSRLGDKEDFAKRIGMDLFRFLESFQTEKVGDNIVIPSDGLDKWYIRFVAKFRKDPDFLTRSKEKF